MSAKQMAFYFDQNRCMGCHACVVACKDWNDVKPGEARWRRLSDTEVGSFPDVKVFNLVVSCNHCANPACTAACPVGAIYKRAEDGIVIVNRDLCQSIKACAVACPYGAPQFADDASEPVKQASWAVAHPMQKCTMCWDRQAEGLQPSCVASCPQRALDFGTAEEIAAKYPTAVRTVVGFPQSDKDSNGNTLKSGDTVPSIFFKPKE
ncbi:4Fe-4S dicluster domain-containing protein [Seleniivibrio woodruffii]|uniref:Anaerobic dimethyl sulfoxide reductase subunit B (Iron-sulfur subunit) n=2 Tax=Seleniivibrio woodruffii TaxID=1078050 RepID=A0A4R1K391_9BACT|nr:4Fe-4S dicluster domain-containing protein [Seleniivibrio woodruffii]TCK58163.1 anaerobic dimethyl sulfoxide reductase subunit B (iron-sulfur subunit) [Seleniivibrio woodruffii]TVZ36868.1 anaerobic dimethyl sulfoxide reductase subunit B (iron-sulfur subunit) [Seleniivibrio woodruffii]